MWCYNPFRFLFFFFWQTGDSFLFLPPYPYPVIDVLNGNSAYITRQHRRDDDDDGDYSRF